MVVLNSSSTPLVRPEWTSGPKKGQSESLPQRLRESELRELVLYIAGI